MIDKESGIPYYHQIMNIVQQQVNTGMLIEGQRIPSELEMSSIYGVNRHTVSQAVSELCRTGILHKIKGRGTFVGKPLLDLVEYRLSPQNRFAENIYQIGKVPSSRILRQEIVSPSDEIVTALQLNEADLVYTLDILRLIDARPFMVTKVYLPVKHLPNFFDHTNEFHSLSTIYEEYGITTKRVKSVVSVFIPTAQVALLLDIPSNMPVMKVDSVLKSQDNVLIEYNISYYRGDLAKISIDW